MLFNCTFSLVWGNTLWAFSWCVYWDCCWEQLWWWILGGNHSGEISTMDINPICIITVLVLWLLLDPEARSSHHKVVLGHTEWVPFWMKMKHFLLEHVGYWWVWTGTRLKWFPPRNSVGSQWWLFVLPKSYPFLQAPCQTRDSWRC